MKRLPFSVTYQEVLMTNGWMLALLAALYSGGWLFTSGVLFAAFVLVALLFAGLELALCLRAWLTGQVLLALVYTALFAAVARLDWLLLQQLE